MAVGRSRPFPPFWRPRFSARFPYEKFRTAIPFAGHAALAVELDETPIGTYLELEGGREDIDRAARALGRVRAIILPASYWVLYRDFCRRHGRPLRNMVFFPRESKSFVLFFAFLPLFP